MIIGLGSDLIDIRRIEKTLDRFGDRFLDRIFTEVERAKSDRRAGRVESYAKRFAAKEGGVETRADDAYDDDSALARGRRKTPSDGCASSSEEDDDLPPPNRNRPPPPEQSESEEESSDEEDG